MVTSCFSASLARSIFPTFVAIFAFNLLSFDTSIAVVGSVALEEMSLLKISLVVEIFAVDKSKELILKINGEVGLTPF